MGRATTRLTDNQLKAAKPGGKDYVLVDGDGLQFRVRASGSRLWNFNYYHPITKKRLNMGLGSYPELSLAKARKYALEARELLAQGIDPKAHRDQTLIQKKSLTENTLEKVATEWFELKKSAEGR